MTNHTEIKKSLEKRKNSGRDKPPGWIGVDLDATLASYSGWISKEHIGEPIIPVLEKIKQKLAEGHEIRIFTARASDPTQVPFVEAWCEKHIGQKLMVTCCKDFACEEIWDDRAKQVVPNSGVFIEDLI